MRNQVNSLLALLAMTACSSQRPNDLWHAPEGSVQGIHYEVTGSGPAVVLIHGGGLDSRMWGGQVEALAPRFTVIRYDTRGFGQSEVPDRDYTHVADLLAVLDTLDVSAASLVGLSLGGAIALNFALLYPERTEQLLLVAPAVPGARVIPEEPERFQRIGRLVREGRTREAVAEWLASRHMAAAMEIPGTASLIRAMAEENHEAWHPYVGSALPLSSSTVERLPEIRVPTSILVGSQDDRSVRELAELVRDSVPGASLEVLEGAGHIPNLEAPAAFNRWLLSHLLADPMHHGTH